MQNENSLIIQDIVPNVKGICNLETINISMANEFLDLGFDSQILFTVSNDNKDQIILKLQISFINTLLIKLPKLYLDYGMGFSEAASIYLTRQSNNKDTYYAYLPVPYLIKQARLDITEDPYCVRINSISLEPALISEITQDLSSENREVAAYLVSERAKHIIGWLQGAQSTIDLQTTNNDSALLASSIARSLSQKISLRSMDRDAYLAWLSRIEPLIVSADEKSEIKHSIRSSDPLLSVIMPVYDPPLDLLVKAIESLKAQTYSNWELCIADDSSKNDMVRLLISNIAEQDSRIKFVFREKNGHISACSNSAADLATGDFLVLMDNDDVLPPYAFSILAEYIINNPTAKLLFSDEDKLNLDGVRCQPYFKGEFDRFLLYGHNMFSHLGAFETKLFREAGKFRVGYEGSQDYDLVLRCMEMCGEDAIVHIPHVLYHWRQVLGSTSIGPSQKSYAFTAAKKAINDHFKRMSYPLVSVDADVPGIASVRTISSQKIETISVVIPTRDNINVLKPCIESLINHSDPWVNIVIVDNGSEEEETLDYFKELILDPIKFKIIRSDDPFNFSALCNLGAAHAEGNIICFLNNDTELLNSLCFDRARALLSISDVGIVGGRLLYPDSSIQHFGVCTGVGEHGVAEHLYLGQPDKAHSNFSKSSLLQQVSAVTGACLFIKKFTFDSVNGFDENLAVAYNDIDICLKVRNQKLKVLCDPGIRLVHKESKSRGHDLSAKKKERLDREAEFLIIKWGRDRLKDPFYSQNYSQEHADFTLPINPRRILI